MEEKLGWEPLRWSPFDSELVWANRFGKDCWPKAHSALRRNKQGRTLRFPWMTNLK